MTKWKRVMLHFTFAAGVVLACFFVRYGLNFVSISGESMLPTLQDGKIVRYKDTIKEYSRGDIVLLRENGDGKTLVKRIIGLPGDTVSITDKILSVNGVPLSEYDFGEIEDAGILAEAPLLLKEDEYFCLGDNYNNSRDSRSFGPIRGEWITGLVVMEK